MLLMARHQSIRKRTLMVFQVEITNAVLCTMHLCIERKGTGKSLVVRIVEPAGDSAKRWR